MDMNAIILDPPFNVIRASHVVPNVRDPDASARFYTDLIGLVVCDADGDAAYQHWREESRHLVLQHADRARCPRIGMRVRTEQDTDDAKSYYDERGIEARIVAAAFQGRTLHVHDSTAAPLEFVATIKTRPRVLKSMASIAAAAGSVWLLLIVGIFRCAAPRCA
jgi:catechol 2,3-dioxygenase